MAVWQLPRFDRRIFQTVRDCPAAQDTYEYPFLGMKLGISKDLKEQMEKKNISMFTDERWNDNADAVTYATASWCTLTDEQKDAEVDKMGTGYDDWLKSSAE